MSDKPKCFGCSSQTARLISFKNVPVGWFCDEHNPEKHQGKETFRQMVTRCLLKDSAGRVRIPYNWNQAGHPFRDPAEAMMVEGNAIWGSTESGFENVYKLPNREQRRAMRGNS